MTVSRYALVAYVKNSVGEFVESLRRELHPNLPHLAAHLTVLPPRYLQGNELAAREMLDEICSQTEPFRIGLGPVETFVPSTATVFIRVQTNVNRLMELHDRLNVKTLGSEEEWPYMPHLTIVKMTTEAEAREAYEVACQRWAQFAGERSVSVEELTFVREDEENCWVDLAGVPLGRSLVSPHYR